MRSGPVALLGLGLLIQAVALVRHARTLWFYGDDYDFLLRRSLTHDPVHALLVPHNEHWSTLPVIAFRMMFGLFGLGHYLPYALMPIAAHLAIAVLLYAVLRGAAVPAWVASLSTLIVAFIAGGAGAQNTLWDFQIGLLGSGFFGLLALLLLQQDGEGRWWRPLGVAALVLSLLCSGIGLLMVAWACPATLLRRGLLAAVYVGIVPVVVYVVWYLSFGHGHSGAPPANLTIAPLALMGGLAYVWSGALDMAGAGPAVLIALVAAVALPRHGLRFFALAASGLIALVLAYALFGFTRSGLGLTSTQTSRYLYFGVLFCGPAIASGLSALSVRLRDRMWIRPVGWILLGGVAASVGLGQLSLYAGKREAQIGDMRQRLVAAVQLKNSGAVLLSDRPDPTPNPDILIDKLASSSVASTLPAVRPSAKTRLQVASTLQVGVSGTRFPVPSFSAVDVHAGGSATGQQATLSGCTEVDAPTGTWLTFRTGAEGGQVQVTLPVAQVQTQLIDGAHASVPQAWEAAAGRPLYVGASKADVRLRVYLPEGRTTVCPA